MVAQGDGKLGKNSTIQENKQFFFKYQDSGSSNESKTQKQREPIYSPENIELI